MTQLTRPRRSGRSVARRRPRPLGRRAAPGLAAAGLAAALASGLSIGSLTVAGGAAAHAGTRRAPAAHSSGMLLAWGNNQQGELGNGSADPESLTPVSVKLPHGTKVTQFRTASFSIALTTAGKVLTWGYNKYGSLGNGKKDNSSVPVRVKLPRGTKVKAVRAGGGFALALTSTGKVLAWGYNRDGELGNGKTRLSRIPVSVHLPRHTRIKAISAGTTFGYALTTGGRVLAWGYGRDGELGNGKAKGSHIPVGVHLPKGTRVTQVSAGGGHALALTSAGRVLAWGYGQQGELGNGRTKNRDVPVRVRFPAGTHVVSLYAGAQHSLAQTAAGHVFAWGYNADGQLGDGSVMDRHRPVRVLLPTGTKATSLAAGSYFSMALTSAGRVLTWGGNNFGQLGNGVTSDSSLPVAAHLPPGRIAIGIGAGPTASTALAMVRILPP